MSKIYFNSNRCVHATAVTRRCGGTTIPPTGHEVARAAISVIASSLTDYKSLCTFGSDVKSKALYCDLMRKLSDFFERSFGYFLFEIHYRVKLNRKF